MPRTIPYVAPTSYVTQRAPLPTDDSSAGYAAGHYWTYNGSTWKAIAVAPGQANWQLQQANTSCLCDSIGFAPLGAYGTIKLVNAYGGNAFTVTRTSDSTTKAIGFINGVADWASVDAFCAGTQGLISTWNDQSGGGFDLTQATQANMPRIYGNKVGNNRSITFDGNAIGTATIRSMNNATIAISGTQNCSTLFIGRTYHSGNNVNFGTTAGTALYDVGTVPKLTIYNEGSTFGLSANAGNGAKRFATAAFNNDTVQLMISNATALTLTQNNFTNTLAGGAATNNSATGFTVGNTALTTNYQGCFEAVAFVLYNAALGGGTNPFEIRQRAFEVSGIQPQVMDCLLFVGDSITYGYCGNTPVNQSISYAGYLQKAFPRPLNIINIGVGAETTAQMITESATWPSLLTNCPGKKFCVIFAGTNDWATSSSFTGAQTYTNLTTLSGTYQAAGWTTILVSALPRDGSYAGGATNTTFETARQAMETLIVSGWPTICSGFVDLTADPVIGAQSVATNTTFFPDNVHPAQPLTTSYIAAAFERSIATLLV